METWAVSLGRSESTAFYDETSAVATESSVITPASLTNGTNPLDSREMQAIQDVIRVVVPIIFSIVVVVGLVGNSLVVIVVKCNPQMYSPTNLLILNLAMADLLFIIFCVPFTGIDYAFSFWPFGNLWCKVVQYLIFVCAYASIYTLVLMSLDRYLAVVHPITSISLRTIENASRAVAILWVLILVFCIPHIFTHNVVSGATDSNDTQSYSVCVFMVDEYNYPFYQITFFIFSFIIPILIISVLYFRMLKMLWVERIPGRNMSSESIRSKRKVTMMIFTVISIFVVCWIPVQIVLVLRSLNLYTLGKTELMIQITSQVAAYTNSCVNPILYAFFSENFRKAFRRVILYNRPSERTANANADAMRDQELTVGMCHNSNASALNGKNDV